MKKKMIEMLKALRYNCYLNIKKFKMRGKTRVKIFIFGKILCFDYKYHGFIM